MGFQKIDVTRLGPNPQYFVNFGKQIKEGMDLKPIRDYFQNKVDQYKLDVEGMVKIPDANADVIQPGLLDATQELKNEYVSLTQFRKKTSTNSEEYIQAGKKLQQINGTLNQYDADLQRIDAIQKEFADNPYMYDNILDGHHLSDAGEIYLDLSRGGMVDSMSNISGYEFRDKLYFTHRESGKEFSIDELVKPTTPDFGIREKVNKDFGATMELAVTKGKDATINEVLNIETYLDGLDQLETADLVLNNKLNYYTTAGPDGIMGTPDDTDPTFMRSVTAADSELYKQFFIDTFENAEDYLKDPNNDSWKNWIYPGFAAKAGLREKQGLTVLGQGQKFRTQYYSDVLNQGINAASSLYDQKIAADKAAKEEELRLAANLRNRNNRQDSDVIEANAIFQAYADIIEKANKDAEGRVLPNQIGTPTYKQAVAEQIISELKPKDTTILIRRFDTNTQNDFFKDENINKYFVDGFDNATDEFPDSYLEYMLGFDFVTADKNIPASTSISNSLGGNRDGAIILEQGRLVFNKDFLRVMKDLPMGTGNNLDALTEMELSDMSAENTKEGYRFLIQKMKNIIFNAYTKGGNLKLGELLAIKTDKNGVKEYIGINGDPSGTSKEKEIFIDSAFKNDLLDRSKAQTLGLFPTYSGSDNPN